MSVLSTVLKAVERDVKIVFGSQLSFEERERGKIINVIKEWQNQVVDQMEVQDND